MRESERTLILAKMQNYKAQAEEIDKKISKLQEQKAKLVCAYNKKKHFIESNQ